MNSLQALLFTLIGCSLASPTIAQTAVTDGVSHELAITRQTQVNNVTYALRFEIPSKKEASVTGVGFRREDAQIAEVIVQGVAVNMIDGEPFGYRLYPCEIHGTGNEDVFAISESMFEFQIALFAMGIVLSFAVRS